MPGTAVAGVLPAGADTTGGNLPSSVQQRKSSHRRSSSRGVLLAEHNIAAVQLARPKLAVSSPADGPLLLTPQPVLRHSTRTYAGEQVMLLVSIGRGFSLEAQFLGPDTDQWLPAEVRGDGGPPEAEHATYTVVFETTVAGTYSLLLYASGGDNTNVEGGAGFRRRFEFDVGSAVTVRSRVRGNTLEVVTENVSDSTLTLQSCTVPECQSVPDTVASILAPGDAVAFAFKITTEAGSTAQVEWRRAPLGTPGRLVWKFPLP